MRKLLLIVGVLSCLARPCQAGLELVGGPPRSFGGRTITRTFKLDVTGPVDVEWRTRILRGIVERGTLQATGPCEVTVQIQLPAVRARVELVQEIQARQAGKAIASGEFPMDLFPEGVAAPASPAGLPAETPAPIIGVIEEGGALAAFLEKAGWRVTRLATDFQFREVESKVVVVAPDQPESDAEPMNGLGRFVDDGGTVIFLDQSDGRKNLFDRDHRWEPTPCEASSAEPLMKAEHPLLLEIKSGDLTNWAGSGRVAQRALAWDDWPWQRTWLCSPEPQAKPLLAEYWNGKGRVIFCQCELAERLDSEPVAQQLLRNILCFAQTPPPAVARIVRFAFRRNALRTDGLPEMVRDPKPEELEKALACASVLVPDSLTDSADRDLAPLLAAGCPAVIQSEFDEEMISALNHLAVKLWPRRAGHPTPQFVRTETQVGSVRMDYGDKLVWGLPAETLANALINARNPCIVIPENETPGFRALTLPGVLAEFKRDKVRVIFCALPLDDPKNEYRQRIVNQALANLAANPEKEGEPIAE